MPVRRAGPSSKLPTPPDRTGPFKQALSTNVNLPKLIPAFATAFASSFADKASQYLDELAVPVGTILAALAIGILIERLALRFLYRFFEKRGFIIGRRLIRSFNGIITIWFGLAAFRA